MDACSYGFFMPFVLIIICERFLCSWSLNICDSAQDQLKRTILLVTVFLDVSEFLKSARSRLISLWWKHLYEAEITAIHKNKIMGIYLLGYSWIVAINRSGGQYHSDFGLLFDVFSVYDPKYGLNLKMLWYCSSRYSLECTRFCWINLSLHRSE